MKIKKETLIRTAILFISMLNNLLVMTGKNPLPYSETQMYEGISMVISVLASVWAWWKNNSFTQNALKSDEYKRELDNKQKL